MVLSSWQTLGYQHACLIVETDSVQEILLLELLVGWLQKLCSNCMVMNLTFELAHGHALFSKHPPLKVLLMTLQNAPPGLDYERDKRFSKEMVATCLVKDPKKHLASEKLLKHHFFKHARS
ncbi:hypothetical protein ES332_D03G138000v1 [Gossypium tomentosum]|nr:hypothetical protein ES332_D03G138000v1 [Gossypium tomentosum]